jgi:hypothetical protein
MANVNAPYGAILITDAGKQLRVRRFPKKSGNAIYEGDFVIQDATGTVDVAVAGSVILGVAMESKAATNTDDIAICDDPEAVFSIQASANAAATDVFANADVVATAGDTGLSRSKHALDSASINTTNSLQLKIIGLHKIASNAYGSYAQVKVLINKHAYKSGVLGV